MRWNAIKKLGLTWKTDYFRSRKYRNDDRTHQEWMWW